MPEVHRQDDTRECGAQTIVTGQSTVYVNGKLWAVEGDEETHGGGSLIPSYSGIYVNGKKVIVNTPDQANPDSENHPPPPTSTASGSPDVFAYSN